MKYVALISLFAVVLLLPVLSLFAQDALPPAYEIKTDTAIAYELNTGQYQMLPDNKGSLTIERIVRPPYANQFFYRGRVPTGVDTTVRTYWFRYRIKNGLTDTFNISLDSYADESNFYVFRTSGKREHFYTGDMVPVRKKDGLSLENIVPLPLHAGEEITVYYQLKNRNPGLRAAVKIRVLNTEKFAANRYAEMQGFVPGYLGATFLFAGFCLLAAFFNLFFFRVSREKAHLYFSLFLFAMFYMSMPAGFARSHAPLFYAYGHLLAGLLAQVSFIQFVRYYFHTFRHTPRRDKALVGLMVLSAAGMFFTFKNLFQTAEIVFGVNLLVSCFLTLLLFLRRRDPKAKAFAFAILPFAVAVLMLIWNAAAALSGSRLPAVHTGFMYNSLFIAIEWAILFFTWGLFRQYDAQRKQIAESRLQVEQLAKEKEIERRELIERQKAELEVKVQERTAELKQSLEHLRATQKQLVQSEKMASLGELTAGIAHEIQNPLNFVNNFSDVNKELMEELRRAAESGNTDEVKALAESIWENEQKIGHHGRRADAIVKNMLQHSRKSTGEKQPTDINALADEYLRLAHHGMRAKDKSFNARLETRFDSGLEKVAVVPQDIGKVLLNLFNNAFYAVNEKKKALDGTYEPLVSVVTKSRDGKIEITIKDNGTGISPKSLDKIFQPFFTTKPTGEGTGLGLSLSYDIITKGHGGELKVKTKEGEYAEFIITLPCKNQDGPNRHRIA